MAKGQGCDETGVRFELIEIGVRFQLIHALAARHGDSFFWSFAQKMVPRPGSLRVVFARPKYPAFDIGVSRDRAFRRFYDT
jgi:hypothetical protein